MEPVDDPRSTDRVISVTNVTVWSRRAVRIFPRHLRVFVVVMGLLLLYNLIGGAGNWLFWLMVIWGSALVLHYMYVKSLSVDDDWANDKASDILDNASDRGHMESILERRGSMTSPLRRYQRGGVWDAKGSSNSNGNQTE